MITRFNLQSQNSLFFKWIKLRVFLRICLTSSDPDFGDLDAINTLKKAIMEDSSQSDTSSRGPEVIWGLTFSHLWMRG